LFNYADPASWGCTALKCCYKLVKGSIVFVVYSFWILVALLIWQDTLWYQHILICLEIR